MMVYGQLPVRVWGKNLNFFKDISFEYFIVLQDGMQVFEIRTANGHIFKAFWNVNIYTMSF